MSKLGALIKDYDYGEKPSFIARYAKMLKEGYQVKLELKALLMASVTSGQAAWNAV